MATCAFRDAGRTKKIYATHAIREDRKQVFYCPNPCCTAHLHICAVDGSRKAYFRATPKHGHIKNCPYGISVKEFDAAKFDETRFVFNDALSKICTLTVPQIVHVRPGEYSEGEAKKHPPRTLKQIYTMCKEYPVTYVYGGTKIADMILDDRSLYNYAKGCVGNKVVETIVQRKIYSRAKKEIYLGAPIAKPVFSLTLRFMDKELFDTIVSIIYHNQDKIIVVAGEWAASTNRSSVTSIYGRRQISIVNK